MQYADDSDMASAVEELEREAALSSRVQYTGVSLTECEECDEPIPVKRQLAIPGVRLCIYCATQKETHNESK